MDRDVVQMLVNRSLLRSADLKIKYLTALKYVINYSAIVTTVLQTFSSQFSPFRVTGQIS